MNPIRILLNSAIDYAGLFPPASLGMVEAVANYHEYRTGQFSWALGRFVVTASRLPELQDCMQEAQGPLTLSVVAGADPAGDLNRIAKLERHIPAALVEAIEWKAHSTAEIDQVLSVFSGSRIYFEIPVDAAGVWIEEIARKGARAKVRTGGTTPGMFPSPSQLAQFIGCCAYAHVAFKATAGLHHLLRSAHPLTYEPSSPVGKMYGFFNVLFASAAAFAGEDMKTVEQILREEKMDSFKIDSAGIGWRNLRISCSILSAMRERFFISFGSCSFEEPISETKALGIL